jgi:hypothetical protein
MLHSPRHTAEKRWRSLESTHGPSHDPTRTVQTQAASERARAVPASVATPCRAARRANDFFWDQKKGSFAKCLLGLRRCASPRFSHKGPVKLALIQAVAEAEFLHSNDFFDCADHLLCSVENRPIIFLFGIEHNCLFLLLNYTYRTFEAFDSTPIRDRPFETWRMAPQRSYRHGALGKS